MQTVELNEDTGRDRRRWVIWLIVVAVVSWGFGILSFHGATAGATTGYVPKGVTIYLGTFITGPTSTEFTLIDNSRGPVIKYTCAFTPPVKTGANTWRPNIQCNK